MHLYFIHSSPLSQQFSRQSHPTHKLFIKRPRGSGHQSSPQRPRYETSEEPRHAFIPPNGDHAGGHVAIITRPKLHPSLYHIRRLRRRGCQNSRRYAAEEVHRRPLQLSGVWEHIYTHHGSEVRSYGFIHNFEAQIE